MSDIAIIDAVVAFQPYDVPKDSRIRRGAVVVFSKGDSRLSDYGIWTPGSGRLLTGRFRVKNVKSCQPGDRRVTPTYIA